MRYVHVECLHQWRIRCAPSTAAARCNVCQAPYICVPRQGWLRVPWGLVRYCPSLVLVLCFSPSLCMRVVAPQFHHNLAASIAAIASGRIPEFAGFKVTLQMPDVFSVQAKQYPNRSLTMLLHHLLVTSMFISIATLWADFRKRSRLSWTILKLALWSKTIRSAMHRQAISQYLRAGDVCSLSKGRASHAIQLWCLAKIFLWVLRRPRCRACFAPLFTFVLPWCRLWLPVQALPAAALRALEMPLPRKHFWKWNAFRPSLVLDKSTTNTRHSLLIDLWIRQELEKLIYQAPDVRHMRRAEMFLSQYLRYFSKRWGGLFWDPCQWEDVCLLTLLCESWQRATGIEEWLRLCIERRAMTAFVRVQGN